jgi:phenylacetate-CoA ligase
VKATRPARRDRALRRARDLDPGERERALFARLPRQLELARGRSPYYREAAEGVDLAAVGDRAALARLPVTRKSELHALQQAERPFGGLLATPVSGLARIFMSPGPIYDPEGRRPDFWQSARTLFAAGFRAGDVVLNCFSYHLTPAGSMFETGLHHLGVRGDPGRNGSDRDAGARHRRPRALGLRGHAVLPQDHPGEVR